MLCNSSLNQLTITNFGVVQLLHGLETVFSCDFCCLRWSAFNSRNHQTKAGLCHVFPILELHICHALTLGVYHKTHSTNSAKKSKYQANLTEGGQACTAFAGLSWIWISGWNSKEISNTIRNLESRCIV